MSCKPITPGEQYEVQPGDTLRNLAAKAYGDPNKWTRINRANQSTPNDDTAPLIPGNILNVPAVIGVASTLSSVLNTQLINTPDNEVTVILGTRKIVLEGIKIFKHMDTSAWGWSGTMPWIPGDDPELDALVIPYTYTPASVYIGSKLQIRGALYIVAPSVSERKELGLQFFSLAVDAEDSNMRPPYQFNNTTLEEITETLIDPFGLDLDFQLDTDGQFDRVTANSTDKVLGFLKKLTSQRGALLTTNTDNDVVIKTATLTGQPVGEIEEGDGIMQGLGAIFDGRKRWHDYRGLGPTFLGDPKVSLLTDDRVPKARFKTFSAEDTTKGDIETATRWRRNKQIVEALTIPITVNTFFAPNDELWQQDTLLSVVAPSLFIPRGFTFSIKSVMFDNSSEKKAVLNVVPPQAFNLGDIVDPWDVLPSVANIPFLQAALNRFSA